jgi:regulator of replication initiation timing
MKLIPSKEAITIVEVGLLSLRQTTQGIRKSLGQDIRKDKIREAEKRRLNVQQFDAVRKKDAEKIVEAKQSDNFIKGGINNIMRGAKSIFQGLLSAAGWILLDYIVQKLPEIVAIVNKVTRIVKKLWDAVQQTWSNIQTTFKEIKDVFRQFAENIKNFDFLDSEGKLRKEFDDFTNSATKLNTDLSDSFTDIGKELSNLGNISQEEFRQAREQLGLDPKPTTPMIPYTPYTPPETTTPPAETRQNEQQTQVPPGKTLPTKENPIAIIISESPDANGKRYFFDPTNREVGMIPEEEYQKNLLLQKQGKVLLSERPYEDVYDAVQDFKRNNPDKPLEDWKARETKQSPVVKGPPAKVEPTVDYASLPPLLTKTYPGQGYGAKRTNRDGSIRRHAGTDFEISGNEEFYSRIGGVVTFAANAGGHYGNVVEVYNAEMGVTERIAEAREILVKEGDVVRAGQPVVRGEDLNPDGSIRTGVIHYEIRKGKAGPSGSFAGTMDPVKFLRDLNQKVEERYPNIGMKSMDKYASIFESPNGGKLNSYELAQAPEVIPFDIAMVLNSETPSGTLTETGTGAIALAALESVPDWDDTTFMNVRQTIMSILAYNRK